MNSYLDLLSKVLKQGVLRPDRTGVGTRGLFGEQLSFDLQAGFPLLTTKKLHTRSIIHELLWFLSGSTNVRYLQENGVRIWDEWADADGELGPVYGALWRSWPGEFPVDQIQGLVDGLRRDPYGRRHIVTAWNPALIHLQALPPCHCFFQLHAEELTAGQRIHILQCEHPEAYQKALPAPLPTEEAPFGFPADPIGRVLNAVEKCGVPEHKLSLKLTQRSADIFLGVPFNIASYALLTHMIARAVNMVPGNLIISFGDVHLYNNHVKQAEEQLSRFPRNLPKLVLNPVVNDLFAFRYEDIEITGYDPLPSIKAEVAV